MDTMNFTNANFHHLIILIQRDDGKKQNFGEGSNASECLRLVWCIVHHLSEGISVQTAVIMCLCTGLN